MSVESFSADVDESRLDADFFGFRYAPRNLRAHQKKDDVCLADSERFKGLVQAPTINNENLTERATVG